MCGMFTDVPMDYFCALDQNGQRHDIGNHPELTQGSVEYLAPQEYMVRVPSSPLGCTYQFMTFLCNNVCMSAASAPHSEACSAALNHSYLARNGRSTGSDTSPLCSASPQRSPHCKEHRGFTISAPDKTLGAAAAALNSRLWPGSIPNSRCLTLLKAFDFGTQVRPPMPPRFFFVIDVSTQAVQSGSLLVVCQAIKDSLDSLPGSSRTQIGFLTFDSSLHFYNLKSSLSQPQMLVRSLPPDMERHAATAAGNSAFKAVLNLG